MVSPAGENTPLCFRNQVPTFAVRETNVSRQPLRVDSALRALSSLRGLRGAPIMPRDAVSRTANVGENGVQKWVKKKISLVQSAL